MGLSVNAEAAGDFELIPEDVYIARCYRIIDLGTQTETGMYGTKQKKKVMLSWEILDDPKMEDGRPFSVHSTYTASLGEKANLRKDLESWRNKDFTEQELEDFDLRNVLGAYCQLTIVHSKNGKYANVKAVTKAKFAKNEAGEDIKPALVNPNVVFDIDEPDMKVFESLSDNVKAKIMSAPEWGSKEPPAPKVEPSKPVESENVKIEDLDTSEPVNLDDIPF